MNATSPCRNIAGMGPRAAGRVVPGWFQLTKMYDEVRAGAIMARSRSDAAMETGEGRCVDPDVNS